VFSAVGIVFKGSGFYRTDSRNGSGARSDAPKDKTSGEPASPAKPSETGNGSADKTVTKKSETVSTSAKSAGEKVA
jgi:hypothetical protein